MKLYVSNIKAWAPNVTSADEWNEWKSGAREILNEKDSPKIEFTDPLFRRRFSQLTKMTVQVVHDLVEERDDMKQSKIVFTSLRGEIEREFTINKKLIEDEMILPAAFSLSVFNAPIAAATIALGLKGGYEVIFPSKSDFSAAMVSACASVLSGDEKNVLFVYADEKVLEDYGDKIPENALPLAFGFVLSSDASEGAREIDVAGIPSDPKQFLREIL